MSGGVRTRATRRVQPLEEWDRSTNPGTDDGDGSLLEIHHRSLIQNLKETHKETIQLTYAILGILLMFVMMLLFVVLGVLVEAGRGGPVPQNKESSTETRTRSRNDSREPDLAQLIELQKKRLDQLILELEKKEERVEGQPLDSLTEIDKQILLELVRNKTKFQDWILTNLSEIRKALCHGPGGFLFCIAVLGGGIAFFLTLTRLILDKFSRA